MLLPNYSMRGRKRSFKEYPPCDRCGSSKHVVGYGKRFTQSRAKQTYYCKKCKHKFTPDDGFKWVRFPPDVILAAVRLHQNGLSFKQTAEEIGKKFNMKVGESTVLDWSNKYANLARDAHE